MQTKVCIVKAVTFPAVMYGCKSWSIKKAECRRISAFKLWCWWRPLRVLWTARSNQSILKEINPEYSLEGLMLKLQYLATCCGESPHWKRSWCWERLRAKWEEGSTGWMRWLDIITDSVDMNLSKLPGDNGGHRSLTCCNPWGHKESRHNNIQQSDSDIDILSHVPFHYDLLQDIDYSSPCLP